MKTFRWILVPIAGFAGYYLAMLSGLALFYLGMAACPRNEITSGLCGASWFAPYTRAIMFGGPSLAATFMILGTSLAAPSHRRFVAAATLALGSGLAIALGRRGFFLGPAALSILVGSILTAIIWKGETPSQTESGNRISLKVSGAFISLACCVILLGISSVYFSRKIGKAGPYFGRGPFTEKDLPRLTKALEEHDHEMEAIYSIGKIGPAAAPAVPLIVKRLDSGNSEVLQGALFALNRIGPAAKEASPRLREFSLGSNQDTVRGAMKTLAGIGDYDGVVKAGLKTDYYHEHGLADAVAEHEFSHPELESELQRLFTTGSSDYVKETAAVALARVAPNTPGLVEFLGPVLEKDSKNYPANTDPKLEWARLFHGKRITMFRLALSRIGTAKANELLSRFPGPAGRT